MATGKENNIDMDADDYEHFLPYYLYVGNHLEQYYQEYVKNHGDPQTAVSLQETEPQDELSQPSSETSEGHPTPRQFEKMCYATAGPACERLAAETRQNVKLIEPRTIHTYRYKDAKTGEMVEKGIKPDMIIAFSHDGVRGKNVVVDAKSHKGAIQMSDYRKLDRDRKVTKSSHAILFINTNSKLPKSVEEAVEADPHMNIIRYNGEQPNATSREFVDKVGPHVSGSEFRADDQRYENNKQYVDQSDLKKQKYPNPLGKQNSELTKNTHRHFTGYDFRHPRKPDGSLDRDQAVNEGLKEDGTLDMRLNENKNVEQVEQHLTQAGEPDMRFAENKNVEQVEQHLTQAGEPDMRFAENKNVEEVEQHLTQAGEPDMRFAENKNVEQVEQHLTQAGEPDMRFAENKNVEEVEQHLTQAGEPDMRFAENKNVEQVEQHLTQAGEPDMRFAENKNVEEVEQHLTQAGEPDMRFKENQEAVASAEAQTIDSGEETVAEVGISSGSGEGDEHLKADGTPDMRYSSNREDIAEMEETEDIPEMNEGMSTMSLDDGGADSAGDGPLKADGTPDMRFSANQKKAQLTILRVESQHGSDIHIGGHWYPLNCLANQRLALIICYRQRDQHLRIFLNHIHPFLKEQQLDYTIIVVNQNGKEKFNRGALFNVGYIEAIKLYSFNCFIFHDVDLLPEDSRNIYQCHSLPRHMSVAVDKFNYRLLYPTLFGGVTSFHIDDFVHANGFPNVYWGWGNEDDDMYLRVTKRLKKNITRYPIEIARYQMIRTHGHKSGMVNPYRDKLLRSNYDFDLDGLNTIRYNLHQVTLHRLFTLINVTLFEETYEQILIRLNITRKEKRT
ncbi:hypothetical protein I4U23_016071 [Adineta vaga]|nr:hypothetical protein I4U23_016071 [Adineta vaga]